MGAAICMELSCLPRMHVRACACVHARACAHVLGAPQTPPTHLPHPPGAEETQIARITITLERIKIIQFCLKIWDP